MTLNSIPLQLGFFGLCAFATGLHFYWKARAVRDLAVAAVDDKKIRLAEFLAFTSQVLLWGGVGFILLSVIAYCLFQKRQQNDRT